MHVLKFGGTSVGSVASITNVKKIVERRKEPVIVVVSALGGITDRLIATANKAAAGDETFHDDFRFIRQRHHEVAYGLLTPEDHCDVFDFIDQSLEELYNLYKGIFLIRELSPRTLCTVVSYGERISSRLVAAVISGAEHVDSREIIKTRREFDKNICDFTLTSPLVCERLGMMAEASGKRVVVMGGFIATDGETGEITNLGRGGSDYTAAIVAAELGAEMLEIWTDVDGFMTADPRVINNAYVIPELSFTEATDLCNFGAKVIYPPTIFPVFHKNIPIVIKNTFNPDAKGTLIGKREEGRGQREEAGSRIIKGISSINDTCLVTVTGLGMVGVIGVNKRIFSALANNGISVFFISQASSENNSTIGVRNSEAEHAIEVLTEEFKSEIAQGEIYPITAKHDLATVAVVGEGMRSTPGVAGKLFRILGLNGINVIAMAQGASETNISFIVDKTSLRKTLNVIHDGFFISEYHVLNVFLTGVGGVGRSLLEQIRSQQEYLLQHKNLQLRIVGLSNSRKMIFTRDGIDLNHWEGALDASDHVSTPKGIRDAFVDMNIFNAVFVDCTANADIAALYNDLLEHNINVVCANKIAASAPYEDYARLKETAHRRDVKYLFETNVGAGLPIINTINNLINSGDEILKIEAVVSGTLNFIFNTLSADIPMSQAIRMAVEAGYAEPDPRLDLNGSDVVRKIVILSREAGYRIDREDVEKHLFLDDDLFEGSLDEFWEKIKATDAHFEEMRQRAEATGHHFRFVAKLEDGHASVSLREVEESHPFYHLEGSNNIILLTTARYKEYPMLIQGYGAGVAVTAAGVFADIISVANVR
ncbi:MAG: bifunctional aspartate kinase/homoserine dehydrogenase I [Bacteroidales bacterium]|nr:bifunctional aspartate kinase/homoserine dehydrogenase I [Bacteroidales bacterium]